jgi:hypothetical protein
MNGMQTPDGQTYRSIHPHRLINELADVSKCGNLSKRHPFLLLRSPLRALKVDFSYHEFGLKPAQFDSAEIRPFTFTVPVVG